MAIDYDELREMVRNSYANPSPEIVDEVIKHTGSDAMLKLHSRWADVFADIAVITMREMELGTDAKTLIEAMCSLSIGPLQNLFMRIPDPDGLGYAQMMAARFLMTGLSDETEFVKTDLDMPEKAVIN